MTVGCALTLGGLALYSHARLRGTQAQVLVLCIFPAYGQAMQRATCSHWSLLACWLPSALHGRALHVLQQASSITGTQVVFSAACTVDDAWRHGLTACMLMEQARKEAVAREDVEGMPLMGKPGGRLPRVPASRE